MTRAAAPAILASDTPFRDGLGERRLTVDSAGQARELLCIRSELTAVPAFEFALRERVARVADFRHPYFAPTRAVERLTDVESSLAIVSDRVEGVRLSHLFAEAATRGLNLEINAAICLIRQIVPAIARLHESCRDVAHGALSPERVVLTATGRLMVTDYTLGAALEQLRYSQDRYWRDLRVALPRSAGLPRVDQRGDVTQIGVIALSLILSRNLRDDEFPARIADVVTSAKVIAPRGGFEPLPPGLRHWLLRALQVDVRHSFATVAAANEELEHVLTDLEYPGLPASVDAFLGRYHAALAPQVFHSELETVADATAIVVQPVPPPTPPTPPTSSTPPMPPTASVETLDPLADFLPELPPPVAPAAATGRDLGAVFAELSTEALPVPDVDAPKATVPDAPIVAIETPAVAADETRAKVVPLVRPDPVFEMGLRSLDIALAPAEPVAAIPPAPPALESGLEAESETVAVRDLFTADAEPPRRKPWLPIVAAIVVAGGVAIPLSRWIMAPSRPAIAAPARTGELSVTTTPAGVEAWIDGRLAGLTPLTMTLDAGSYSLELRAAGVSRTIPVTMSAGGRLEQFIDLPTTPGVTPTAADAAAAAGPVATDPGAAAAVPNAPTSPPAGTLAAPPPVVEGWILVRAPIDLTADADGRPLGTTAGGRLALPVGRYTLTLRNEALGYRTTRPVEVTAGKGTTINVTVPDGRAAVNASPWAEVTIDGKALGETPLGDLQLAIGTHEVVLRHPEYGERRASLTVTLSEVARLSIDMRTR